MKNHGVNSEVAKRHYARLKNKELESYTKRENVASLRKAISSKLNPLNEKSFKELNERHYKEISDFDRARSNQASSASMANNDPRAPDVDSRQLNETNRSIESSLCRKHASELINFRDTKVTTRDAFNQSSNKGLERSTDKSGPTPQN